MSGNTVISTRWILVVGTGRQSGLPDHTAALAEDFGRGLAKKGWGLVVGGWPGVDYLVAKGFASVMGQKGLPLADNMIQVNADHRSVVYPENANYPDFKGGHTITVPTGAREWIEALKYADAVIMLEGEGGTFETYYYATQEQRPVFAVLNTGGDAKKVYVDIQKRWELLPYQGFTKGQFLDVLSQPIDDEAKRSKLIKDLFDLFQLQFSKTDSGEDDRDLLFISYAHEDRPWLVELRNALRPLERKALLSVWEDNRIEISEDYMQRIKANIEKASIAILLVSDAFTQSDFINKNELPLILEKHSKRELTIFWFLVSGELYRSSPINRIQAAIPPDTPLASLSPAAQQDAFVKLRNELAAVLNK